MNSNFVTRLRDGAEALGLALSPDQLLEFQTLAAELEEWNKKYNLTAIPPESFVELHALDSLCLAAVIELNEISSFIDVGTGAGFPGLPISIAFPALDALLVDGTRKRLVFVDHIRDLLGLKNLKTLHARAEEMARVQSGGSYREHFDLAVARAVAPLPKLMELLLPFVRLGGRAVALKGEQAADEIRQAQDVIAELGGSPAVLKELRLPGSEIIRRFVIVQKTAPTPAAYPRRKIR